MHDYPLPLIGQKGVLAPLGVPDVHYLSVDGSRGTFILNALVYDLKVEILSGRGVWDLLAKYPRRVVVSQCNPVYDTPDQYCLVHAVVEDDYVLTMWDWDYGRPNAGGGRNPYLPVPTHMK